MSHNRFFNLTQACEEGKAVLRKRILEQECQISKLYKQVAFLRHGFTTLSGPGTEAAGFHDLTVKSDRPLSYPVYGGITTHYERNVHRCILASKSKVMKTEIAATTDGIIYLTKLRFNTNRRVGEACGMLNVTNTSIYNAFIDYFYVASVPEPSMKVMWADLLLLALFYNVAGLRDDCVRYISDSIDNILSQDVVLFTEVLSLGMEFNSLPIITWATDAYFKLPAGCSDSAEFKRIVQAFPHVEDVISQASRSNSDKEESKQASNANVPT